MSDFNSSLPVRTETNGDVAAKIVDSTIPSQGLKVNGDGSINVTDNGVSLTVDAVDLDIRDLDHVSDSVEVFQATHDDLNVNANIQVGDTDVSNANPVPVSDGGGSLTVDATDLDIRDLDHTTDSVSIGDGVDLLGVNADGSINTRLFDGTGTAFGPVNPLPVTISKDGAGDEINEFKLSSSIAAAATDTHDYTVTAGKTFLLTQVEASGSGKAKMTIEIETGVGTGTFDTKFVQFNSTSNPNMSVKLESPISVDAGVKVRVSMTNRDLSSQDLYSTISGQEI